MTDIEKLTVLKALVGVTDNTQDAVLTVYLTLAKDKVLHRTYPYDRTQGEVPDEYCALQCEIAAFLWNKRGAEGQTAHSENGIARQYESGDVPESMLKRIIPRCGTLTETQV